MRWPVEGREYGVGRMLKQRDVLDDVTTLAASRDRDPATPAAGTPAAGADAAAGTTADGASAMAPATLAQQYGPGAMRSGFAARAAEQGAGGPASLVAPAADAAPSVGITLPGPVSPAASSRGSAAAAQAPAQWLAPQAPGGMLMAQAQAQTALPATGAASSDNPPFSKAALATTQPHQIDFTFGTFGPQSVFGTDTTVTCSLPSALYQHFSFGTGVSVAGFGLQAGVSVTGGIKGGVTLSAGQFAPDFPITIDPNVVPFVQDGQVFDIDPTLVSTNDASFALSLPQANVNLDFGLKASAGFTFSFPSVPIGVTIPGIGFVGFTLSVPSQTIGVTAGSIFKLPGNTSIKIPGDGSVTVSELQSSLVNSGSVSALGGLPTIEMSGNTAPFFMAQTDLVALLAEKEPDPFAVLAGSKSFADGLASIGYHLLGLPLSGSLWLNEDVTLTPIAITETVTDLQNGDQKSGILGANNNNFTFTAPATGNGIIPLSITYGLELSVTTTLELDGDINLTLNGPSVSGSIAGISKTIGPLGSFTLLNISGKLATLFSKTFIETTPLSVTDVVDVQNFANAVTQTISGQSGEVSLNKPATDLLVAATGTVKGAAYGVHTGTLSAAMITDYGLISVTGSGVDLQEGGTVDVMTGGRITARGTAPGTGILAMVNEVDAVDNFGAITGFSYGVQLAGGSLKNETGAVISATNGGVSITNANAAIVNNGTINATSGVGVDLALGGSLYNAFAGVINGDVYGVDAAGAVTVENSCTLTGGGDAIRAYAGGNVTNLAGAYIHSGAIGVHLRGGASETVTNGLGATISGVDGVSVSGANVTVVDSGLISGTNAAVELYGTATNTLVLDPDAQLQGGVRFSSVTNTISLTAGSGNVGTLAGIGSTVTFQGTIAIDPGAAWDFGGNLNGVTISGLNTADVLNDTAISYSAGERVRLLPQTDVLSIFKAGSPTVSVGTIQLYGTLAFAPSVTAGASGGIAIDFGPQSQVVSLNNGEVDMTPTSLFAQEVTVNAGVTVSANYYGPNAQRFGVYATQERATLTNLGTIIGYQAGVELYSGGLVTNAAGALISGEAGLHLGSNSIDATDTVTFNNAGTVTSQGASSVYLFAAGTITNETTGQITSGTLNAVQLNATGTVFNQGTMSGGRSGARLFEGGFVYNQTGALLAGGSLFGVEISGGYGKVVNCGTITSAHNEGVYESDGGLVLNESGACTITGATEGVKISGAAGNISNGAYIQGVLLTDGGTIVNSATGTIAAAAVSGYGVSFYNSAGPVGAYLHNMGLIDSVQANGGDLIVNDGTIDGKGVIAGTAGGVTLENSGTIQGVGGTPVQFGSASDRLIAETGADFVGAVKGGGGTLELGAGTGTLTNLGSSAASVSGAEALTAFGFASYQLDVGGTWTLNGTTTLAAGETLTDFATLTGPLALGSATDRLVLGAGASIGSAVKGVGATLELASGTGTISGLGAAGTISGTEAMTFSGFGAYFLDTGSSWTLSGNSTLSASQSLTDGGSVTNLGALTRASGDGIVLTSGAAAINGAKTNTTALISDVVGVYAGAAGPATVTNFGTITGTGGTAVQLGSASDRLIAESGSHFVGAAKGGGGTLEVGSGTGTLTNLGAGAVSVSGAVALTTSGFASYQFDTGGSWTLAGTSTLGAGETLTDFATITGPLALGSASDKLVVGAGASIGGAVSGDGGTLELASGAGTISGIGAAGTIGGGAAMTFSGFGSYILDTGSSWTLNGASTLGAGMSLTDGGSMTNLGALTDASGDGIVLTAGAAAIDGAAANATALISGLVGVYAGATGPATVTSFGTIQGTGGVAVQFKSAADQLIVESGSTWLGSVQGAGGLLDLAGGTGTVTGIGSTGTVSGAEAMTFSGFGSYEFGGGAWTLTGTNTIALGQTLVDQASVTSTGALNIDGAVTSTGTLTVSAGTASIDMGAVVSVKSLSLTGGVTTLNESLTFQHTFTDAAGGTLAVDSSDTLTLEGSTRLSGLIDGAGTISAGAATFNKGFVLGGTDLLSITGAANQTGSITIGDATASAAKLTITKSGTWSIGGAFNIAEGTATTSSLTVAGTLTKAGTTGKSTISLATTDNGLIEASAGTLDLAAALAGSGSLKIDASATLEVDAAAAKGLTATFNGATATLALKAPTTFASTIAGFAPTDTIDLIGITAKSASINAKDQLVIKNGAATVATLKLTGTYTGATFTVASDGHGGTDVTMTAAARVPPPPAASPLAFIAAMARVGGAGGAAIHPRQASMMYETTLIKPP
jgi:hypothetical protein